MTQFANSKADELSNDYSLMETVSFASTGLFYPPQYTTTTRNALTGISAGLVIYNTTTNKLNMYNGSTWEAVTSA